MGVFKGLRPDITPAQVVGLVAGGIPIAASLLHVFGVFDLSASQTGALNDLVQWAALAAGALFVSDAGLRAGRANASAKVDAAVHLAHAAPQGGGPEAIAGSVELSDPEADAADADVSDEEELSAPPPDESNTPVQPSQRGLAGPVEGAEGTGRGFTSPPLA